MRALSAAMLGLTLSTGMIPARSLAEPYEAFQNRHFLEVGLFGGVTFFSDEHELYGFPESPHGEFRSPEPMAGLRLGYYPLSFLGIEAEGAFLPVESDVDSGEIYNVKGHLIGQLPFRVAPFLLVGGGIQILNSDGQGDDLDHEFHYGGGVKVGIISGLLVRAEARHLIAPRFNGGVEGNNIAHHVEVLGGLSYTFGGFSPDDDGDGVANAADECPAEAGRPPTGCPDRDGDAVADAVDRCPDEWGEATWQGCPNADPDDDGVLARDDRCPNEAGVPPSGCPDEDGDGIASIDDACPDEPGVEPDGCPPRDADGDGLIGAADQCPEQAETLNGYQDGDGCPDEVPERVLGFTDEAGTVKFAFNSAEIDPASRSTLDEAAEILAAYPDIRIEVQGHTDAIGPEEANQRISTERAESVRLYLIDKGVEPDRVEARGYGERMPVADNSSRAGRARNRRIEFQLVTDRAESSSEDETEEPG